MKVKIFGLLAAAILAGPMAAHAQSLVGGWQGNLLYPAGDIDNLYGLDLSLDFLSQTSASPGFDFTGELAVTCTAVSAPKDCGTGGLHPFVGTLSAGGALTFATSGAFSGSGTLAAGGNHISGKGTSLQGIPISFEVSRVSAPEIDAASATTGLALLLGGLVLLRGRLLPRRN